jgi:hypothetical protein
MSEFVNFNKRDIDLPPGCKDLFDLLQLEERAKGAIFSYGRKVDRFREWIRTVHDTSNQVTSLLSDIGKYVDMVMCSTVSVAYLTTSVSGRHVTLDFYKHSFGVSRMGAVVKVKANVPEEKAVREFLHRHCFEPIDAKPLFSQYSPVYRINPLPAERDALVRLFVSLFHETCGLTDTDEMAINFREAAYPSKGQQ